MKSSYGSTESRPTNFLFFLRADPDASRIHGSFDWKMEIEIPGRTNRIGENEIHLRMSGLPRKYIADGTTNSRYRIEKIRNALPPKLLMASQFSLLLNAF